MRLADLSVAADHISVSRVGTCSRLAVTLRLERLVNGRDVKYDSVLTIMRMQGFDTAVGMTLCMHKVQYVPTCTVHMYALDGMEGARVCH